MTRTSTRTGRVPPSRRNSRSWSTRRNFACAAGVISVTSSRNNTPPAANSIWPGFDCCAPVNAPRSNPKSSDSRSCSGNAAQLIAMNGPRHRGERWWMNRAMTSLPVPDSPCRHVVASVAATCVARRMTSRQASERPTGASNVSAIVYRRDRPVTGRWSGHHRGRPRRVMSMVKEIGCCM